MRQPYVQFKVRQMVYSACSLANCVDFVAVQLKQTIAGGVSTANTEFESWQRLPAAHIAESQGMLVSKQIALCCVHNTLVCSKQIPVCKSLLESWSDILNVSVMIISLAQDTPYFPHKEELFSAQKARSILYVEMISVLNWSQNKCSSRTSPNSCIQYV